MKNDTIKGLVSIIMPAFNAGNTIRESIDSVLQQSYDKYELIIIDDSSNDETRLIIDSYNDARVKVIDNIYSRGARGARQSGIDIALGQYIAFLDSDDLWKKNKLEVHLNFMKTNQCEFTYSNYTMFSENNKKEFIAQEKIGFFDIIKTCSIGCLTVVIDRSIISDIKIPDIYKEDYALWVLLLKDFDIFAYNVNYNLASYRIQKNSLSSNKLKEIKRQYLVLREVAQLSIISSLYCLIPYILNGIRKHI